MRVRALVGALALVLGLSLQPAHASPNRTRGLVDWPMFHYSLDRRGVNTSETILSPSTVGGLKVAWTAPFEAALIGDPIEVAGVVYAGDASGNLQALDMATGAQVWTKHLDQGCAGTVAFSEGNLFLGTCTAGQVIAVLASNGATLWTAQTGGGTSGSPVVSNHMVYEGSDDGNLYAISDGGAVVWTAPSGGGRSSPATVTASNTVWIGGADATVSAFDTVTETVRWSTPVDDVVTATPAVVDGVVYIATAKGTSYALDYSTGTVLWSRPVGGSVESTMAVADGLLYFGREGRGGLFALMTTRKGHMKWKFRCGQIGLSSPAVANGVVYVGDTDGVVHAVDAATGQGLWSYQTGLAINSSPAVVNGMLFIGSGSTLYAFGL